MPDNTADPDDTSPDTSDLSYQSAFDAASSPLRWLDACLAILTAPIDAARYQERERFELMRLRVAAAERMTRILGSDCPPLDA